MIAILTTAASAAKSQTLATGVAKVGEGVQGLFGDTSKDSQRKARAAALTAAALAGDLTALRQLAFDAFEPANGLPGDNRPVDFGTRSPPLSRDLARKGLQDYVRRFNGLPPELAQYAGRLGAQVVERPPALLAQVLAPTINTITDTALDRAAQRTQETARQYMPLVIGGVALAAVVFYMMSRKSG